MNLVASCGSPSSSPSPANSAMGSTPPETQVGGGRGRGASVFYLVLFFFFFHSSVSAADTRANKVAKDFYSYDSGFTFSDPTLKLTKHLDTEQLGSWYDDTVEEERHKIRSYMIFIFLTKVPSCLYRFFVKIHGLIIHRYGDKSVFSPISSKTKILPCSLNVSCQHCFSSDSLRHF